MESFFNLEDRFNKGFFSEKYLTKYKSVMIICIAFFKYDYSNYYVIILEYCLKNKVIYIIKKFIE